VYILCCRSEYIIEKRVTSYYEHDVMLTYLDRAISVRIPMRYLPK